MNEKSIYQKSKQSYQEGTLSSIGYTPVGQDAAPASVQQSEIQGAIAYARANMQQLTAVKNRLGNLLIRLLGPYPEECVAGLAKEPTGHLAELRGAHEDTDQLLVTINEQLNRLDTLI